MHTNEDPSKGTLKCPYGKRASSYCCGSVPYVGGEHKTCNWYMTEELQLGSRLNGSPFLAQARVHEVTRECLLFVIPLREGEKYMHTNDQIIGTCLKASVYLFLPTFRRVHVIYFSSWRHSFLITFTELRTLMFPPIYDCFFFLIFLRQYRFICNLITSSPVVSFLRL